MDSKTRFDLEDRCLQFSKRLITLCKSRSVDIFNKNIIDQVLRAGTSIGANYIEANDSLGKKDFIHRLKIARKEAKETIFWLKLLDDKYDKEEKNWLINEATQLRNILSAIIKNSL
jgi:four helix bundle protein